MTKMTHAHETITETGKVSKMLKGDMSIRLSISKSLIDHCILPQDSSIISTAIHHGP